MPEHTKKTIALNVNLVPVDHSDQPVFANIPTLRWPKASLTWILASLSLMHFLRSYTRRRMVNPHPKSVEGKLGIRVAVGLDVIQRLHQQLGQIVAGLKNGKETRVHTP